MDEKKPVETPAQSGAEPQSPPQSTPAMPVPPVDPTPPTPSDVPPASGSEPVPPKIQQHLDAVPHANVPIEPHHTKRFWMIVLTAVIVVLAALAGVLGYFLLGNKSTAQKQDASVAAVPTTVPTATPTPDPTAGWQQYSNDVYGFQFKYPATYQATKSAKAVFFAQSANSGSLSVTVKQVSINNYVYNDIGGNSHKFNSTTKEWTTNGDASAPQPQRANTSYEAYVVGLGDGGCGGEEYIIPNPTKSIVYEITNLQCIKVDESTGEALDIKPEIAKDVFLSNFEFKEAGTPTP